ncbi:MAG TPA: hypothetical protein VFD99_06545, partial [Arthrobacter sp.]|nr:hypothetical protein [Arthrobacter sp.]
MEFETKGWKNGEKGGTRLNADGLNDLEQRIQDGFDAFPFFSASDYGDVNGAISAAHDAGGGTVILPKGTVLLEESLLLLSNVSLVGSGVNATVLKASGASEFTMIRNLRANEVSGAPDRNIAIRNLTIDGESDGVESDSRRGFGIELYGVSGFAIEDVLLKDIPLSACEISGDQAAIANGVRTGTEPLMTERGSIKNIRIEGAGWQCKHLSGPEETELWGDAGFGLILRAGARDIDVQGVFSSDTLYGGFGAGQLSNVNSSDPFPNEAQVAHITASGIHVDQGEARATPEGPSIRLSFGYDVSLDSWSARDNAGSQGLAIRQAGTTDNLGIRVSNGWSEGNEYGLIQTGASSTLTSQKVSLSGVHCVGNRKDGFYFEDPYTTATGCISWGNERHNWNFQSPEAGERRDFHSHLIGCQGMDASAPGGGSSECGLQLKDAGHVTVLGGTFRDTRSGGSRTQNYGIRETGVSDYNQLIGVEADNNITSDITTLGTHTFTLARQLQPAPKLKSLGNVSGDFTPDLAEGDVFTLTLTGDASLEEVLSWPSDYSEVGFLIDQDATGGRSLTLPAGWEGGGPIPVNPEDGKRTILWLVSSDGGATVTVVRGIPGEN